MTPFKVILNELDPARKLQVVSELARAFGLDEQVASESHLSKLGLSDQHTAIAYGHG